MKLIYLAHPFRGDVRNNPARAEELRARIQLAFYDAGFTDVLIVSPLAETAGMWDEIILHDINHELTKVGHPFWYNSSAELLKRCDAVIFSPGWENSKGCKDELRMSERKRLWSCLMQDNSDSEIHKIIKRYRHEN